MEKKPGSPVRDSKIKSEILWATVLASKLPFGLSRDNPPRSIEFSVSNTLKLVITSLFFPPGSILPTTRACVPRFFHVSKNSAESSRSCLSKGFKGGKGKRLNAAVRRRLACTTSLSVLLNFCSSSVFTEKGAKAIGI